MADKDPAFMWETEALRSAPQRATEEELDEDTADSERWVTLRQASRATGIPVETLRKWARRGTVPTFLQPTNLGTNLRLVDLDGVQRRAAELGRSSSGVPAAIPSRVDEPMPPGTMIVPVDAWNKMLSQLGNLHEAGQQLAAARERAVKAETEARFLRERLAEMRQEREAPQQAISPEPGDASGPTPNDEPEASPPPEKVWQYLIRRVRAGRIRNDASG
jgi:DNA-binding transcriptional MerR regulator